MSAMGGDRREAVEMSCFAWIEDGVKSTRPLFQHLASRAMRSGQARGEVSKEFSGSRALCLVTNFCYVPRERERWHMS